MISQDFITEWRQFVPWVRDVQVEMDLIISRALVSASHRGRPRHTSIQHEMSI